MSYFLLAPEQCQIAKIDDNQLGEALAPSRFCNTQKHFMWEISLHQYTLYLTCLDYKDEQ